MTSVILDDIYISDVTASEEVYLVVEETALPEQVQDVSASQEIREGTKRFEQFAKDANIITISVYDAHTQEKLEAEPTYTIENVTSHYDMLTSWKKWKQQTELVRIEKSQIECGYYDERMMTVSSKGCHVVSRMGEDITCFCNHTTSFSVLLSVQYYEIPQWIEVSKLLNVNF